MGSALGLVAKTPADSVKWALSGFSNSSRTSPRAILYLSYWFPARHRAGVTALFMAAAPISTALGSPISAALLEMNGVLGFAGWQWHRARPTFTPPFLR